MKKAFFRNQKDTILTQAIKRKTSLNDLKKIIIQEPELIDVQGALGNTAICSAVKQGNYELVRCLLQNKANPNIANNLSNTPLIWAIKEPRINQKIIHLLLEYHADINCIGHMNKTPLTWAVIHNEIDLVELFLRNGADPNIPDKEIGTPILRATLDNHLKIVELLLRYGTKYYLETEKTFGIRLLFTAAYYGHEEIINFLIEQTKNAPQNELKINFDAQWYGEDNDEDNGSTALIFALQNSYVEIAKSLIQAGSSLEITNDQGKSAFDYIDELDISIKDNFRSFILSDSAIYRQLNNQKRSELSQENLNLA
ncbi:MAG: ankyrin repeat domain-containing protein [Waterburya sp.]